MRVGPGRGAGARIRTTGARSTSNFCSSVTKSSLSSATNVSVGFSGRSLICFVLAGEVSSPRVTVSFTFMLSTTWAAPQASVRPTSLPTASGERPKVSAGLHETRTPERRALDTVASGLDDAAAVQYEALAKAHPESVAFREAARILRERGAKGRRSQD